MTDLDDEFFYDDDDFDELDDDIDDDDFDELDDDEGEPADDDRLDPSTQQPDEPGKEMSMQFLQRGPIMIAEPDEATHLPEQKSTQAPQTVDADGRPILTYGRRQLPPVTAAEATDEAGKPALHYSGMKDRYSGGPK